MNELKPCPFCGSVALFKPRYSEASTNFISVDFRIKCDCCGATTKDAEGEIKISLGRDGTLKKLNNDIDKAIEAWNRRVTE